MDKLRMHSPNLTDENVAKIAALFPNCVTESRDEKGNLKRAVDFDLLRQELSPSLVEGPQERYRLDWPGKREALLVANAPIAKTLRPCREESVDFDTTKNLFIEGDNLDALKLLQETYLGKVKMIYIDPPYNTGNDFIYEDDFTEDTASYLERSNQKDETGARMITNTESNGRFHSDWLSRIFSRLRAAKLLLTDDGVCIISIDENEHANLKVVCDEIFGSNNFCGEVIWKNSSKNDQAYVSIQHEYLLFYVKSKESNKGKWLEKKQGLDEIYSAFEKFKKEFKNDWVKIHNAALNWYRSFPASNPITDSKHYSWMDERGVYFPDNISGPNDGQYVYDVIHKETGKPCKMPASGWRYPQATMLDRISEDKVHFGPDHTTVPNNKTYLRETEYQSLSSLKFLDGRAASNRLQGLFGEKVFTNPKDEFLLKDIFKAIGIRGEDIVLDFYAGSASTMHAVLELNKDLGSNCRTISVQYPQELSMIHSRAKGSARKVTQNAIEYLKQRGLPQNLCEISKERIRLVGNNICDDGSVGLDKGFRVLKVDTSNMEPVYYSPDEVGQSSLMAQIDNIREGRTAEDLLFQALLESGVAEALTLPIKKESLAGKEVFFVDGDVLVACFEGGLDEAFIKELAGRKPLRVVFRDSGFANDAAKINAEQIFKQISPGTELKVI